MRSDCTHQKHIQNIELDHALLVEHDLTCYATQHRKSDQNDKHTNLYNFSTKQMTADKPSRNRSNYPSKRSIQVLKIGHSKLDEK